MKVSTTKGFQLIYSLYQHEYLGYLFESFVIQLDKHGNFTLTHQNISSQNASEFDSGLDERDYSLVALMDSIQQDAVIRQFQTARVKPEEFFEKYYRSEKFRDLRMEIESYLESRRAQILDLLPGKQLFEMGKDGEPAWKSILIKATPASVLFHFQRNGETTKYFPTIEHQGEKLDFQFKGAHLVCLKPAWLLVKNSLFCFSGNIDGNKLRPFLDRRYILIPNKIELTYYQKFVAPLIGSFDVSASGFEIREHELEAKPVLLVSDFDPEAAGEDHTADDYPSPPWIQFRLIFQYGPYAVKAGSKNQNEVEVEKCGDEFVFHKIVRNHSWEQEQLRLLSQKGLFLVDGRSIWTRGFALRWLTQNQEALAAICFEIKQSFIDRRKYFLGKTAISIDIEERNDWFDVLAKIRFGDYLIPFIKIRDHILNKNEEFLLPNGEIGIIPQSWFTEYSELFGFARIDKTKGSVNLGKYHVALVAELQLKQGTAGLESRLAKLVEPHQINSYPVPNGFRGDLRPYQQTGFSWLSYLGQNKLGGCLADDMGLGKTVQTLALLQSQKPNNLGPSLLLMPTSLLYNWEKEAAKFTPKLKVLNFSGPLRNKDPEKLKKFDLVLTSYGVTRIDIDILETIHFNYVILDESQVIKNPNSFISKAVLRLQSNCRLILTGTPLENSTLDLWSQMNFINPGLLGGQTFFMREFLRPIEKKMDQSKVQRLNDLVRPFILRRKKSQVATELPPKVENIHYCAMSEEQEKIYEETKSQYRNQILQNIQSKGLEKSQLLILEGLTKLRQLANHPAMIDPDFSGESGKMSDLTHMIRSLISENHKILVFSQFVKHLQLIKTELESIGIEYAYLDGGTRNRKQQVEKFQNQSDLRVFLISLKAGGLGLNLTKADYVLIADPWWNPAVEAQAIDRAHRIGQENKVFIYKFITRNSVEEKILQLQNRKLDLINALISENQGVRGGITKSEVEQLLS